MFDEYYYNYYLPKHTKKATRLLHLAGVLFTIGWIALAFTQSSPVLFLMLLASPFVVYPFAWSSHVIFEPEAGRVPAALTSNPLKAKASDLRMCYEMLTGKLDWGR